MKENTNEIKIESNTDNQKLDNLIEKNNNILLDQKRKRIILDSTINDIDIEMKKSPLSTMNINHSKLNFFPNVTETIEKKMSIDLNDDYINNNNNENKTKIIGCNCKNSGCLKRYCECFTRMKYCDSNCQCKNCFNTLQHEKERGEAIQNYMMKSPISFKKLNLDVNNLTCYCKKSNCLKKYCECYQMGMKCTSNCKCIDCKNRNNAEKKLFEVNIEDNKNVKRGRFYSYDYNLQKEDKLFSINNNFNVSNFSNLNGINIPVKTIQLDNKVIIDNYDIKNDNIQINTNIPYIFQNYNIINQNEEINKNINNNENK
jgi:hypothetical protein